MIVEAVTSLSPQVDAIVQVIMQRYQVAYGTM